MARAQYVKTSRRNCATYPTVQSQWIHSRGFIRRENIKLTCADALAEWHWPAVLDFDCSPTRIA